MTQAKIAELARKALVFHPEQADLIGLEGTDDTIKPYPIDALGDTIRGMALRIQEKTQAPLAICAQSVLTAAALVAQTHLNIRLPHGAERPVSLFLSPWRHLVSENRRRMVWQCPGLRTIRNHNGKPTNPNGKHGKMLMRRGKRIESGHSTLRGTPL